MSSLAGLLVWLMGCCLAGATPVLPTPPAAVTAPAEVQTLTYETAPLLALANNPRVTASLAKVREALARVEVTAAQARPHGLLGLQGPPIPVSGNGSFRNDYVLSPIRVELRQLIYDGGRIMANIEQGKSIACQQAMQAQSDWQQLHFEVRRSYLNTLAGQNEIELATQHLQLSQQQLRQSELLFLAGKVPRGDVLSAHLPVSRAEIRLQTRRSDHLNAQQELNGLLGLALTTPLKLEGPNLPAGALPGLEACLGEALAHRASLLVLEHQLKASFHAIEAGERDNAPQLNLLLGVVSVSQGTQALSAPQYRGGFELIWPFADGGRAGHLADAARASHEANLALLKAQRQAVEIEVRKAYRELQLDAEVHSSESSRVAQAKEALRVARAQYDAGMVNTYPVRQAQSDLLEAQQSELRAYYNYFLAMARLDLACGRSGESQLEVPWPEENQ